MKSGLFFNGRRGVYVCSSFGERDWVTGTCMSVLSKSPLFGRWVLSDTADGEFIGNVGAEDLEYELLSLR